MTLHDWFRPVRRHQLELARRLAVESQALVWQRVAPRAGLLASLCEARGYVRACAQSILRASLARARGCPRSTARQRWVLAQALDLVCNQFSGRMLS